MNIIVNDEKSGKRFLIKGNELDFELFKESKGKDGKNAGGWTTCRLYPTSLPYAVYKVLELILKDPDDDTVCVEAEKARVELGKILADRVKKVTFKLKKEA